MPTAYVQKIAKEKGLNIDSLEKKWKKAKSVASDEGHEEEYDYIMGIFKRMIGEELTFSEFILVNESKFETSVFVPTFMKKILEKVLKSKELKAAVKQYFKFREQGESEGVAKHKAAGMFGLDSDKLFSIIVDEITSKGSLKEDTELLTLWIKSLEHMENLYEEGEPTNTSTEVVPDRDPVRKKKKKTCTETSESVIISGWKKFNQRIDEAVGMKMPAKIKNKVGRSVNSIAKQNYWNRLTEPLDNVDDVLMKEGYMLANEDGTRFAAIFTGEDGNSLIDIADSNGNIVSNTALSFSWHKMPKSGRWEVTMYMT